MERPIDPTDAIDLDDIYQGAWMEYAGDNDGYDPDFSRGHAHMAGIRAVASAVCPEGFVVIPVDALREVIEACTAPDHKYYNLVDGEWLRGYVRNLLPEHIRDEIDAPLLIQTKEG